MRMENKFVLTEPSNGDIYARIMTCKYLFREIFYERRVNNIYLDTITLDNFKENMDGVQNREKHRIRWYGNHLGVDTPILEYKIKHGELGYKQYYPMPSFQRHRCFDYGTYMERIGDNIQSQPVRTHIMFQEISLELPTLYNSYLRRYFLSEDSRFRITIDKDITYKSPDNMFENGFSLQEDRLIVELKYEKDCIDGARRIIQYLGLRLAKNSKYVRGVLGLYFNTFYD